MTDIATTLGIGQEATATVTYTLTPAVGSASPLTCRGVARSIAQALAVEVSAEVAGSLLVVTYRAGSRHEARRTAEVIYGALSRMTAMSGSWDFEVRQS